MSTKFVIFVTPALKKPIHAPLFYILYLFILELESESGAGVGSREKEGQAASLLKAGLSPTILRS